MSADLIATRWGAWGFGRRFPCAVGRGGIRAEKREGDGASPEGIWRITDLLYRPDRIAAHRLPPWARPIGPRDLWSDDPCDGEYNCPVRSPHGFSHEALRRADPLYDLILVTDWNRAPALPGQGSAIFIHRWRRPRYPTAGCLAFAPQDLLWLAHRLAPGATVELRG